MKSMTKTRIKKDKIPVVVNSYGETLQPNESVDVLHYKSSWPNTLAIDSQVEKSWVSGYKIWCPVELNPDTGKTLKKKIKPRTANLYKKGSILVYTQVPVGQIDGKDLRYDSSPTALAPYRVRRHQKDAIPFSQFFDVVKAIEGSGVVLSGVEKAEVEDLSLGFESTSQEDEIAKELED
jgi:hypothetical protein